MSIVNKPSLPTGSETKWRNFLEEHVCTDKCFKPMYSNSDPELVCDHLRDGMNFAASKGNFSQLRFFASFVEDKSKIDWDHLAFLTLDLWERGNRAESYFPGDETSEEEFFDEDPTDSKYREELHLRMKIERYCEDQAEYYK